MRFPLVRLRCELTGWLWGAREAGVYQSFSRQDFDDARRKLIEH